MSCIETRLSNIMSANELEQEIQTKQDILVSEENVKSIKTVNYSSENQLKNNSLVGSGSIFIPGVLIEKDNTETNTLLLKFFTSETEYKEYTIKYIPENSEE